MAVFNGGPYLEAAIESVLAELAEDDEFIVVDDGSTDGTADLLASVKDPRLTVITQNNAGQAAAYNAALVRAHGAYLAFNDADDLWAVGRLQHQLSGLGADPALDGIFGASRQFISPELDGTQQAMLAPATETLAGRLPACLLIRRASFDRVGPFDPKLRYAHFYQWLSEANALGLALGNDPRVVHLRRLHPNNIGRTRRAERDAEVLRVLRGHLGRRRTQSSGA
jgi:glycosyltransferase involved in cell wall biosynthesis